MCDGVYALIDADLAAVSGGRMNLPGNGDWQDKQPGSLPQTGNVGTGSQFIGGGVLAGIIAGVIWGIVA
jgi:hypothetical protein